MILNGDALENLRTLPDGSVRCCVTSPPYWGLRDYGHDGQLGLERTPEEYVSRLVEVFREVRRVLSDDGTLWCNLGDSFARDTAKGEKFRNGKGHRWSGQNPNGMVGPGLGGLKPKDLVGIPWRVAFALQADGWYLRSDIVWSKPNPMPESVTDRPTKAHEYLFLLSKQGSYYYDAEAIAEPVTGNAHPRGNGVNPKAKIPSGWDTEPGAHTGKVGRYRSRQNPSFSAAVSGLVEQRNRRSVWTIPTEPYPEAHFATFPQALVEPCILAGSAVGDTVLDPFAGSGRVGMVARRHGREIVLIELNPDYVRMARRQVYGPLFAEAP